MYGNGFINDHNGANLVRCVDPLADTMKLFNPNIRKSKKKPKSKLESVQYRNRYYTTRRCLTAEHVVLIEKNVKFKKLRQEWWDFRDMLSKKGMWHGNSPEMRYKRRANKQLRKILEKHGFSYYDCPLP